MVWGKNNAAGNPGGRAVTWSDSHCIMTKVRRTYWEGGEGARAHAFCH